MVNADGHREVQLHRVENSTYEVTNARGGRITISSGENDLFTPVELLLAAIAGCSAVDVDLITSRRAVPESFDVTSSGVKVRDDDGNHLTDIEVTFSVRFPSGAEGDSAREALPRAIEMSRDRLCTVSRTIALPTPVTMGQAQNPHESGVAGPGLDTPH